MDIHGTKNLTITGICTSVALLLFLVIPLAFSKTSSDVLENEIKGFTIGMTESEVRDQLTRLGDDYQIKEGEMEAYGHVFLAWISAVKYDPDSRKHFDQIFISFPPPVTERTVVAIKRVKFFNYKTGPTLETVEAALSDKYGTPSTTTKPRKTVGSDNHDFSNYLWGEPLPNYCDKELKASQRVSTQWIRSVAVNMNNPDIECPAIFGAGIDHFFNRDLKSAILLYTALIDYPRIEEYEERFAEMAQKAREAQESEARSRQAPDL